MSDYAADSDSDSGSTESDESYIELVDEAWSALVNSNPGVYNDRDYKMYMLGASAAAQCFDK